MTAVRPKRPLSDDDSEIRHSFWDPPPQYIYIYINVVKRQLTSSPVYKNQSHTHR